MSIRKHREAQIIDAPWQLEAWRTAADLGRERGVRKHPLDGWKAKYGGLDVSEAPRPRQLEDENRRRKKWVADRSLGKDRLQAVIRKNGWSSPG